jgi:hypothetical protein
MEYGKKKLKWSPPKVIDRKSVLMIDYISLRCGAYKFKKQTHIERPRMGGA